MSYAISAIVMAFNEKGNMEAVVREIDIVLGTMDLSYEIIIVDDGSCDSSGELADRLAEDIKNARVIHHRINKGLGEVYRTGFSSAKGAFVTFFPADGQFPADIIKRFVPLMEKQDMVLGYLPDGKRDFFGAALSWAEKLLFRLLFGPLPKFQGVLMFRRELLDKIKLNSGGRGWTILLELIVNAKKNGYRIISVPIPLRPRRSGKSKVKNIATIWANLRQAVVLRRYL